jgi:hypothetical protein
LLQSSPLVVVAAVAVGLTLGAGAAGPGGLARLKTTNVQPASSPTPQTSPAERSGPALPDHARPVGVTSVLTASASGGARSSSGARAPGASAPYATRRSGPAASSAGLTVVPQVIDFSDPTGDATVEGTSASAASDPSLDITEMRYETTAAGLRVTMRLAAGYASDGLYTAYLTDARTGWQIQLELGGPYQDYAYAVQWSAGGATVVKQIYMPLPNTPDPAPNQLVAVIPWRAFLSVIDPHDAFNTISAQSRRTEATGNSVVADDASTTKTFGPLVR